MSDEELFETYEQAVRSSMDEAYARTGFASNMARESIVAGLRAVANAGASRPLSGEQIEAAAVAMYERKPSTHLSDKSVIVSLPWDEAPRPVRHMWRKQARVALEAAREAS
jgi:hypothetical protein